MATTRQPSRARMIGPLEAALALYVGVVIVQGVHVGEHILQLVQVYAWGVPDDEALGLLGYIFQFQGTEEWLHLAFNGTFLLALYLVALSLKRLTPSVVPTRAFQVFLVGAVGLETWHMAEHAVIISNVIANNGCPCPGIADPVLGVSDTVLHFFYNAIVYVFTLTPFWYVMRARPVPAPGGAVPR
jgi:hypothetical protein